MLPSRQKEMLQWASGVALTVAGILAIAFLIKPEVDPGRLPASSATVSNPTAGVKTGVKNDALRADPIGSMKVSSPHSSNPQN